MHELSVAKQVLERVLEHAERNGLCRVTDVHLKIGVLRGMVDEWLKRYFAYAGKGSLAEGAVVHIDWEPGSVVCRCGAVTPLTPGSTDDVVCVGCGGTDLRIRTGLEFLLVGIGALEKERESHGQASAYRREDGDFR